jgi:probable HAF family extracellular repeat protein
VLLECGASAHRFSPDACGGSKATRGRVALRKLREMEQRSLLFQFAFIRACRAVVLRRRVIRGPTAIFFATRRKIFRRNGTIAVASRLDALGGPVLNNRGQVVGTSTLAGDDNEHAFLWTSGTMIDLGTLGGDGSQALAINEAGQVVGRSDFSSTSPFHHAFLWQHGTMTDLGVVAPCQNGTAVGINSRGQVIADMGACGGEFEFSAFVWQAGQPIADLNTLVSPPSELHIEGVAFISERGEIAGIGVLPNGDTRAVSLMPLPGKRQLRHFTSPARRWKDQLIRLLPETEK